jgi:hypothetical protein
MKTHPHIQGRFLTRISTSTLIEAVESDAFTGFEHRTFRALLLAEIAYRMRLRSRTLLERIWRLCCGTYRKLPRGGFIAPSQAFLHDREWSALN